MIPKSLLKFMIGIDFTKLFSLIYLFFSAEVIYSDKL